MKVRLMSCLLLILVLGISVGFPKQPKQSASAKKSSTPAPSSGQQSKIIALSPKGNPPEIKLIPLAPRPASLDGKTVYFVDDGFQGGEALLKEMIGWFSRNMPSVKTEFRKKAGGGFDAVDKPLMAEIKEKGDAMVMATGH